MSIFPPKMRMWEGECPHEPHTRQIQNSKSKTYPRLRSGIQNKSKCEMIQFKKRFLFSTVCMETRRPRMQLYGISPFHRYWASPSGFYVFPLLPGVSPRATMILHFQRRVPAWIKRLMPDTKGVVAPTGSTQHSPGQRPGDTLKKYFPKITRNPTHQQTSILFPCKWMF